jgi:hypothetical protein
MVKRESERDRFLEMLRQHNLDRTIDAGRFEAINKQYEFSNTQWEAHSTLRLKLLREQAQEQLVIAERSLELNKKILARLPDAVLAVRNEMEMPLDREFYEAQWRVQTQKMEEAWVAAKARLTATLQSSAGTQPT